MAVGTQPTVAQLNSALTAQALSLRNNCQAILNLFETINAAGGGAGLEAGFTALGFSTADATTASQLLGYMNTIAGIHFGTATQGTAFNFANALAALWAGT